ncbi:hypothetical protein D9M71_696570 [compost metagenome]
MSVIGKVEVLEARIAPGFMAACACMNTAFLTCTSSNTASTTKSHSASSEYSPVA